MAWKLHNIFCFYFLGLCLGIFVTRQCTTTTSSAANHLHHATQASPVKEKRINGSTKSKSGNSNNDIHKYSVTTISTNCNESNKSHGIDSSFKQISAYETNCNAGCVTDLFKVQRRPKNSKILAMILILFMFNPLDSWKTNY